MSVKTKIIITSLVFALPALLLGRIIWRDPAGMTITLSDLQMAGFIAVAIFEALAFGVGIAFIIFGRKFLREIPQHLRRHATWAFYGIAWTLVSWWPHDNMHRSNGMNMWGLLRIDLLFHITLIISALIIASYFVRTLRVTEVK